MSHAASSLGRLPLARRYARHAIKEAPDEWICLSTHANLEFDAGNGMDRDNAVLCFRRAVQGYEQALVIAARKKADAEAVRTLRAKLAKAKDTLKKAGEPGETPMERRTDP